MRHLAQRRVGPALAKSAVLDLPICLGHFIVSRTASAERLLPSCCRRDVKPENIVIEGGKTGGRVYLVDFGGVQVSGHTTLLGVCVCGSVCVGVQVSGADLALFLCASCPPDTAASRPALTPASSHTDSACSALPMHAERDQQGAEGWDGVRQGSGDSRIARPVPCHLCTRAAYRRTALLHGRCRRGW